MSDPFQTVNDEANSFVPTWSSPPQASPQIAVGQLVPGTLFAGRYEILKLLGEGGMGSVFKARDVEVDRTVALKLIRPELANDKEILNRFKQELILARKVTHKNVVRIFDLSQFQNVKYISMEFVEGADLHSLMKEGQNLTLVDKVKIIHQVCRALDAAHSEGVVHRDLKPQNIMVENSGRVVVMDFGVAHSMDQAGFTRTGALLGTPAYMSPEQAKGEKIDTRSDLFSIGVIFYELLTGNLPYQSESMMGMLMKRIHERAQPPIELDPQLPQAINDCVMKCLSADLSYRYQSAQEIMRDLEGWEGAPDTFRTSYKEPPLPVFAPQVAAPALPSAAWQTKRKTIWTALAAAAVVITLAGYFLRDRFFSGPAGTPEPVTLMIADISNHTGDQLLSGTLEPVIKIALEDAGFINAYDRSRVRELGLPPIEKPLEEGDARQIALNQGLGVVLSGSLDLSGGTYNLSLRAIQVVTGNVIGNASESAPNKDEVLHAATKAASVIRTALGDSTAEEDRRFAMESLSATSLEAVHEYALAMQALSYGRSDEALQHFSKAVDFDENFGTAYGGMAIAASNLGDLRAAEGHIKSAFTHIDRMTERERFRLRGSYYGLIGDYQQCVQEYGALLEKYPFDVAAHNNIGKCYSQLRNLPRAIEEMEQAAAILTKRPLYRFNAAVFRVYAGDFAAAEKEVTKLLEENPKFEGGYLTLAYAQLAQGRLDEAAATYRKLQEFSPTGASSAIAGLADLAIYQGRFSEAVRLLEQGAASDLSAGRTDSAASKFAGLSHLQLLRGQPALAVKAADAAMTDGKSVNIRFLAARAYAEAGQTRKASAIAKELSTGLQREPQAYAKLIEGELALQSGDYAAAVRIIMDANSTLDTWIGHFDLGKAYLEAGAFPQADSAFDRCIQRRGEAMEIFMDSVPTYGYFPTVYYYLGRAREGQKTAGFADSYRTYLKIREQAGEDPLLADIKKRIQ